MKFSLSKGCSLSIPSLTKAYFISIGKISSRLYNKNNGENFVEICLLTQCANSTSSIMQGNHRDSHQERSPKIP